MFISTQNLTQKITVPAKLQGNFLAILVMKPFQGCIMFLKRSFHRIRHSMIYNSVLYSTFRRGLSRVDHPTSALEIVDHSSLPREFSQKIVEAISK